MSNKSQLQENNSTLEYVIEQLESMPTTEDCMQEIARLEDELQTRITPISKGGTGATTINEALANLGIPSLLANVTHFEAGSYKGSGVHSSLNSANILSFNSVPKAVFIYGDGAFPIILLSGCTWSMGSSSGVSVSNSVVWEGNTVKWYASNVAHQNNVLNQQYYWYAIY